MTQPTALFLADILEDGGKPADIAEKCAAELRRLHAENEALRRERDANLDTINVDNAIITRLRAQRDALLEALKYHQEQTRPIQRTIDAIKAAEENTP